MFYGGLAPRRGDNLRDLFLSDASIDNSPSNRQSMLPRTVQACSWGRVGVCSYGRACANEPQATG